MGIRYRAEIKKRTYRLTWDVTIFPGSKEISNEHGWTVRKHEGHWQMEQIIEYEWDQLSWPDPYYRPAHKISQNSNGYTQATEYHCSLPEPEDPSYFAWEYKTIV